MLFYGPRHLVSDPQRRGGHGVGLVDFQCPGISCRPNGSGCAAGTA
ncbi:hypothetical protein [Alicyclobacillus vulcanalis]|nr:hypothetical protein [Alicyclobacillus vulcanalis]